MICGSWTGSGVCAHRCGGTDPGVCEVEGHSCPQHTGLRGGRQHPHGRSGWGGSPHPFAAPFPFSVGLDLFALYTPGEVQIMHALY